MTKLFRSTTLSALSMAALACTAESPQENSAAFSGEDGWAALDAKQIAFSGLETARKRCFSLRMADPAQVPIELSIQIVDPPLEGKVYNNHLEQPDANGLLTVYRSMLCYEPAPGFVGTDSFRWQAVDGQRTSRVAQLDVLVRSPQDPAGATVLLVVHSDLLPHIRIQIDRLMADLRAERYTPRLRTWSHNDSPLWDTQHNGAAELHALLRAEYDRPGQFLSGAMLIGRMPLGATTTSADPTRT